MFIFGLVCYFWPGSQKVNILTAQYERISDEQALYCIDAKSLRFSLLRQIVVIVLLNLYIKAELPLPISTFLVCLHFQIGIFLKKN